MPAPQSGSDQTPGLPLAHYASVAHVARVYDYLLGGKDNFAADREAAEQAMQISPDVVPTARANRAFLARVTRHLAGQVGLRQFLDIGTGGMASVASRLNELMAQQTVLRDHSQVAGFFAGLDLIEPGLVRVPKWRPALAVDAATPPRCGRASRSSDNQR